MKHWMSGLAASLSLATLVVAGTGYTAPAKGPIVELVTSKGNIRIQLEAKKAPVSTKNFLSYVKAGHYKGTIFHRVIPGFMVQGGGFTPGMQEKRTRAAIRNEAGNGLRNSRGTLAMARTSDPNSATSQFFINVANNRFLDRDQSQDGVGYAVFGRVIKGMDVVDKIVAAPTTTRGGHSDVPSTAIVIKSARVVP
jgi:peptidyl-prolyl cis-trans isomerase A (cyclophilin A)